MKEFSDKFNNGRFPSQYSRALRIEDRPTVPIFLPPQAPNDCKRPPKASLAVRTTPLTPGSFFLLLDSSLCLSLLSCRTTGVALIFLVSIVVKSFLVVELPPCCDGQAFGKEAQAYGFFHTKGAHPPGWSL